MESYWLKSQSRCAATMQEKRSKCDFYLINFLNLYLADLLRELCIESDVKALASPYLNSASSVQADCQNDS